MCNILETNKIISNLIKITKCNKLGINVFLIELNEFRINQMHTFATNFINYAKKSCTNYRGNRTRWSLFE